MPGVGLSEFSWTADVEPRSSRVLVSENTAASNLQLNQGRRRIASTWKLGTERSGGG